MVKPHFEYCSSIIFMANNSDKNRLQKLQNKSMRVILKVNRYTSIKSMLDALMWLSVNQRIVMNVLIVVFKMKQKTYPNYLCERLVYGGDVHSYNLRNNFNFRLESFRNEKTKNMLMYNGIKLFNDLPRAIFNEINFKTFKRKIVEYVKQNFS